MGENSTSLLELLGRLEDECMRQKAPIVDILADGIDPTIAAAAVSELGLGLPEEAAAWWSWHNGLRRPPRWTDEGVIGRWTLLSADDSVREYHRQRDLAAQYAEPLYDQVSVNDVWHESWLPLATADEDCIGVDAAKKSGEPGAVIHRSWSLPDLVERYASLSEVVAFWVEAAASQAMWFNADKGIWQFSSEAYRRVPARVRELL